MQFIPCFSVLYFYLYFFVCRLHDKTSYAIILKGNSDISVV